MYTIGTFLFLTVETLVLKNRISGDILKVVARNV